MTVKQAKLPFCMQRNSWNTMTILMKKTFIKEALLTKRGCKSSMVRKAKRPESSIILLRLPKSKASGVSLI